MKRLLTTVVAGIAFITGTPDLFADYNRAELSYDNTSYSFNKDMNSDDANFSANGFGLNYLHGFKVSRTLPMYVEAGLNINFDFSCKNLAEIGNAKIDQKFQNINFQIPVNYTYHFHTGKGFTIAPYAGLNFKINAISRMKIAGSGDLDDIDGDYEDEWTNLLSEEDMGNKDATWNCFQMGWHVGVGAEFRKIYLGLQYGTDFIPAYGYKEDDFNARINTGNFRLMVGYTF